MRFIHMADIHFDSPFTVLTNKRDFGTKRRLEQRDAFKKAIEYIAKEKIPYLFIAGDLYDQNYIRESTIEFINNLFKTIPNTRIFISPGNHDPFLKNSFYSTFNWNNNVIIFKDKIERIEFEDVDIYGFGFTDFYCTNSEIENIEIKNKNKINILIVHGSLDASKKLDVQYNPINSSKLKQIGFDYVALGHIHKTNYNENKNNFIYPGSLISFGFDELGEHGMLDIELEKSNKKINFIKLDNRSFEEKNINISAINSEEELIEKLNSIGGDTNVFYKVILEGNRNIEINTNEIQKLTTNANILKIEDRTILNYNIEELSNQSNLKGIFVKKMMDKLNNPNYDKKQIEKAIEIGLKSFE